MTSADPLVERPRRHETLRGRGRAPCSSASGAFGPLRPAARIAWTHNGGKAFRHTVTGPVDGGSSDGVARWNEGAAQPAEVEPPVRRVLQGAAVKAQAVDVGVDRGHEVGGVTKQRPVRSPACSPVPEGPWGIHPFRCRAGTRRSRVITGKGLPPRIAIAFPREQSAALLP